MYPGVHYPVHGHEWYELSPSRRPNKFTLPNSWLNHKTVRDEWILYDENKYNHNQFDSSKYIDNYKHKIFYFNYLSERYYLSFVTVKAIYHCCTNEKNGDLHIKLIIDDNKKNNRMRKKDKDNFDDISSNWLFIQKLFDIKSTRSLIVSAPNDTFCDIDINDLYGIGFATKKDAMIRDKSFIYYLQKSNDLCCYGYIRDYNSRHNQFIPECIAQSIYCYYNNNLPNLYIEDFVEQKKYVFILPIMDEGSIPPLDIMYYLELINQHKLKTLNANISLSFCKRIIQFMAGKDQQIFQTLFHLFQNDKLTASKKLGDFMYRYDPFLAATIYRNVGLVYKAIQSYIAADHFESVTNYILETLPKDHTQVIVMVYNHYHYKVDPIDPLIALYRIGYATMKEIFHVLYDMKHDTSNTAQFLTNYFFVDKNDKTEDAEIQTKFFEICIKLKNFEIINPVLRGQQDYELSYWDRKYVAKLLAENNLYSKALPIYQDIDQFKTILKQEFEQYKIEFLVETFLEMEHENILLCLREIFISYKNSINAMNKVVNIINMIVSGKKYRLLDYVNLFIDNKCWNALFELFEKVKYHQDMSIDDKDHKILIFRYIECCGNCDKFHHLRNVVVDVDERYDYDAERVKNYLINLINKGRMKDTFPLLYCCNKCRFNQDVIKCLYYNGFYQHIKVFIDMYGLYHIPDILSVLWNINASQQEIEEIINLLNTENTKTKVKQQVIDDLIKQIQTESI